jgi:hypothetical protein
VLVAIHQDHLAMVIVEADFHVVITLGAHPNYLLLYVFREAPSSGVLHLQAVDPARTQALELALASRIGTLA